MGSEQTHHLITYHTELSHMTRKPYTRPMVIYELLLQTKAIGSGPAPIDPGMVDPPLPAKPGGETQREAGSVDPPLPPKPPAGTSSGDPAESQPPLPPKSPAP